MNAAEIKHRKQQRNAQQRALRAERRAQGLCTRCGENPVDAGGLTLCEDCRKLSRAKNLLVYPPEQTIAERLTAAALSAVPHFTFRPQHVEAITKAIGVQLIVIEREQNEIDDLLETA